MSETLPPEGRYSTAAVVSSVPKKTLVAMSRAPASAINIVVECAGYERYHII